MAHPGLAGSNALSTLGGTTRHHPHFDATLPHAAVRGEVAYRLRLCGNELDGWRRLTLRAGECGSFDALLEILEERLFLGVITNLAIEKEEPPEDEEEDPFEEITALADLPTAPAEAVLRVKSKCSGARKYPAVQPYHLHPYTLHDAATAGDTEALDELLEGGAKVGVAAGFGGRTAVHCASESGRAQAVLQYDSDPVAARIDTAVARTAGVARRETMPTSTPCDVPATASPISSPPPR